MRLSVVWTIGRKELIEALRDRRTLFMMIGLPLLLYPLMMIGMSRLSESQESETKARTSSIAVWGELPADLRQRFEEKGRMRVLSWHEAPSAIRESLEKGMFATPPSPPRDLEAPEKDEKPPKPPDEAWTKAARQAVLDRKADAVLICWNGFSEQLARGEMGKVSILYDSVRPDSNKARARLTDQMRLYRDDLLKQREESSKLAKGFTTGFEIQSQNLAPEQRRSGMLVGMLLPYMLILFSAMSGFYAAIDMTAGEKERGTMQTLLCAPVRSIEVIAGKFGAVWTIAMIATLVNICSLAMTFTRVKLLPGMEMKVEPLSYLITFVMILPISLLVNAVFLAIGAFARDFKDGQNYLTPVLMLLLMTLLVTMTPGIELNRHLSFVPVLNVALLIKKVFLSEWRGDQLFLVMLSSFCYAGLALSLAAKVFERNNLLLGGQETFAGVLDIRRRPGSLPTPSAAVTLFCFILVLAFYGSAMLEDKSLTLALTVIQYGFFLLPALAAVALNGWDWKNTLSLRPIGLQGALGALLLGLSGWTFAAGVLIRILPPPESLMRAMQKLLQLNDKPEPIWLILLMVAVTPALCEETVFRGVMLSGFRRLGMWPAICATGLLFGFAHASVYRLLPTMFLGILMGFAVWKTRSLFAGMIVHAVNNGLAAVLARSSDMNAQLGFNGLKYLPWSYVLGGTAVLAVGLWLLWSMKEPAPDQAGSVTA
jgi:sodium transport system permease protein